MEDTYIHTPALCVTRSPRIEQKQYIMLNRICKGYHFHANIVQRHMLRELALDPIYSIVAPTHLWWQHHLPINLTSVTNHWNQIELSIRKKIMIFLQIWWLVNIKLKRMYLQGFVWNVHSKQTIFAVTIFTQLSVKWWHVSSAVSSSKKNLPWTIISWSNTALRKRKSHQEKSDEGDKTEILEKNSG